MRKLVSIAGLILVAAQLHAGTAYGAASSLLAESKVVGTMDGDPEPNYWWLTDNKLIKFEVVLRSLTPAERKEVGTVPPDFRMGYYKALTVEVPGGKTEPLDSYNKAVTTSITAEPMMMSYGGGPATETKYIMPPCAVSPDAKWIAWRSNGQWRAAALDGSRSYKWPSDAEEGYVCWLDGRQWVEFDLGYQSDKWFYTAAKIHDIGTNSNRAVAMNLPANGLLVGASPDGKVVSLDYVGIDMQGPLSSVQMDEYDISGAGATMTTCKIPLPGAYRVWSADLSHSGRSIAWVLADDEIYHIYLSDLTGARWRDLGSVDLSAMAMGPGHRFDWPVGVRWQPDDKALSFVFDGKLYLLPVSPL